MKLKYVVGKGLYLGAILVAQIEEAHVHISLKWLREVGFRGDVVVSEFFDDEPLYQAEVKDGNENS